MFAQLAQLPAPLFHSPVITCLTAITCLGSLGNFGIAATLPIATAAVAFAFFALQEIHDAETSPVAN